MDGRIAEEPSKNAEVIDCGGMLVLPGGIDSHTHICGTKVNFGRYMSPEDMRAGRAPRGRGMRAVLGIQYPNHLRQQLPLRPGWDTQPSPKERWAPLEARHTHEEFRQHTITNDGLILTLFDGDWGRYAGDRSRRHQNAPQV